MDTATLALAKAYTDKQRLAYTEHSHVFSYNGKASEEEMLFSSGDRKFAAIAIGEFDLASVSGATATFPNGSTADFSSADMRVDKSNNETHLVYVTYSGVELPAIMYCTYTKTLGVLHSDSSFPGLYCSRVELGETIHTIDPKYLPGVCLPVVDLSGLGGFSGAITDSTINATLAQFLADSVPAILCKFYHKRIGTITLMFTHFHTELDCYIADTGILSKIGIENAPPIVLLADVTGSGYWNVISGGTDVGDEDGEDEA